MLWHLILCAYSQLSYHSNWFSVHGNIKQVPWNCIRCLFINIFDFIIVNCHRKRWIIAPEKAFSLNNHECNFRKKIILWNNNCMLWFHMSYNVSPSSYSKREVTAYNLVAQSYRHSKDLLNLNRFIPKMFLPIYTGTIFWKPSDLLFN